MKNMKVRTKMLTGFITVIAVGMLLAAVGIASIIMIRSISREVDVLQDENNGASNVLNAHYIWRHGLTEAVFTGGNFTGSLDPGTCALGSWLKSDEAKSITDPVILDLLRRIDSPHSYIHIEAGDTIESIQAGDFDRAKDDLVVNILPRTQEVITLLTEVQGRFEILIGERNDEIATLQARFMTIIIALVVLGAIVSMCLALYISNLISKPLNTLSIYMKKAGTTGDVSLTPEYNKILDEFGRNKDEIGQTIAFTNGFIEHVLQIAEKLKSLADGDLTTEIEILSNADTMGISVRQLTDSLNKMFGAIKAASLQVSSGSHQIADGAQMLAQGSTEQAATVQELSASTSEIAEKTKENAELANKAAMLANTIKGNAEKGSRQMDEMMAAVNEINQASQNISQVIKVIDNIAFQTNILALNASVEAARAGQHGKGFAVVAEEVRNLAAKSAEAANDTSELIANSIEKAEQGTRISRDTSESLQGIVSGINESNEIIMEIAKSSETQATGITHIRDAIDQVAQVVQQNSATAEESAAASEQMSGQAELLEQLIEQFKLKNDSSAERNFPYAVTPATGSNTVSNISAFALYSDAGKY